MKKTNKRKRGVFMRRGLKLILTIMFTVLFFVPCITAMGAEGSRNIRIGLNYGYDCFQRFSGCGNGIDIGYSDAERFRLLCSGRTIGG